MISSGMLINLASPDSFISSFLQKQLAAAADMEINYQYQLRHLQEALNVSHISHSISPLVANTQAMTDRTRLCVYVYLAHQFVKPGFCQDEWDSAYTLIHSSPYLKSS